MPPSTSSINLQDHNGLRGISAVWIVVFHCFWFAKYSVDLQGSTMMPLFFLLSGFSLTIGYYKKLVANPASYTLVPVQSSKPELLEENNKVIDQSSVLSVPNLGAENPEIAKQNTSNAPSVLSWVKFQYFRALRIMPVYYLTFLLAIPPTLCGFGEFNPKRKGPLVASLILNIFPVNTWVLFLGTLEARPLDGPAWTVSTLWFFYVCFPSLLRRYNLKSDQELLNSIISMFWIQLILGLLLFGAFALTIGPLAFPISTMWPPLRLPVFIMGICAGLLVLRHPTGDLPWFKHSKWYFPSTLFSCSCTEYMVSTSSETFSEISIWQSVQLLAFTLATFVVDTLVRYLLNVGPDGIWGRVWLQLLNPFSQLCLIVSVTRLNTITNSVTAWLRHPVALWFGNISMSLYLVHMVVFYYLRWILYGRSSYTWPETSDCSKYDDDDAQQSSCEDSVDKFGNVMAIPDWNVLVVFPIATLLAALFFYYVEEPIRKNFKG